MTEIEFLEAAAIHGQGVTQIPMNMIAVIFAYIIAMYFAGKSLSSFVAVSLSITYSLFLFGPMIAYAQSMYRYCVVVELYGKKFPAGQLLPEIEGPHYFTVIITLAPIFLAWIGSMFYAHLVVRKDAS